jgi:HD-GYP domain-containing protein (c-di-GMP phosphodiesterase class II)/DNA-binding CsgD family transcriptional regulator
MRRVAASVRLAELVGALSLATDLGTGQPLERGIRACLVASRLADIMRLSASERVDVFYVPLLAMLGCTAESRTAAEVFGDELAFGEAVAPFFLGEPIETLGWMVRNFAADQPPLRRAGRVARAVIGGPRVMATAAAAHCEVAQGLAARLGFAGSLHAALGSIYERWDGSGRPGARGDAIPMTVRVMHVAWDAQLFYRLGGTALALEMARKRAGRALDPAAVEALCAANGTALDVLASNAMWDAMLDAEPHPRRHVAASALDEMAAVFADFADLKSRFTLGHSRHVADLAHAAAATVSDLDPTLVRRAGLVHDLGRVSVSAAIWDRPGSLGEVDREKVRLHAYYTERILARAGALSDLAWLAGAHHERLDGSGYHRGARGSAVPPAARVLAAADMYQALVSERPHRAAYAPQQAADVLTDSARAGQLDSRAVDAVLTAAGHATRAPRSAYPCGLSEREVDVLRLVVRGLSNRQMASQLSISPSTVHHHVQHIYDKLGVSTRAAATLFAVEHELVS